MWAVYQGLAATIGLSDTTRIVNLLTDCGATAKGLSGNQSDPVPCTWSEDYDQWLVDNQKVDGSWGGSSNSADPVAVAFYINILGATQIAMKGNQLSGTRTLQRAGATSQVQSSTAFATVGQTSSAVSAIASAQVGPSAVNPKKPRKRIARVSPPLP